MSGEKLSHRVTKLERAVAALEKSGKHPGSVSGIGQQDHKNAGDKTDADERRDEAKAVAPVSPEKNSAVTQTKTADQKWYKAPQRWKAQFSQWRKTHPFSRWRKAHPLEWWKPRFEMVGIVFAFGYAFVTFLQWRDLRNNFEADERAWIIPSIDPMAQFQDEVPITITDTGKSAVLTSRTITWLEILHYDEAPRLDADPKTAWFGDINLITPGHPVPTFTVRMSEDGKSRKPANSDEIQALKDGLDYLVVYGFIVYADHFGWHWTKFCEWQRFKYPAPEINGIPVTYKTHACAYYRAVGDGKIQPFKK